MPTFYVRSLNIRLSVADLDKTITPEPLNTLSKESTLNADRAIKQLEEAAKDGALLEAPLCLDQWGCNLKFLGDLSQNMPFLMVQATPEYPCNPPVEVSNTKEKLPVPRLSGPHDNCLDSPLTDLSSPPLSPLPTLDVSNARQHELRALCLRILPNTKSFIHAENGEKARNDIKIDVYLNGDLCTSSYIQERDFLSKGYVRNIFSGARNSRLTERPWVLSPPPSAISDASPHPAAIEQIEDDIRNRWTEVSNALKTTAVSYGRNARSELPVIGQYLQNLAEVPVPAILPGMLKTDHKRFAIIDVVVINGKGNKDPADGPYLFRPLPLKLYGYEAENESSLVSSVETSKKQQSEAKGQSSRPRKSFADQQIAMQPFSLHHVPRNSLEPLNPPSATEKLSGLKLLTNLSQRLPRVRKAPTSLPADKRRESKSRSASDHEKRAPSPVLLGTKARKRSRDVTVPATLNDAPLKKRRMQYHTVLDARQTWAEEIDDIARQAADKDAVFFTERRITRSKLVNAADDDIVTENTILQESPFCQEASTSLSHLTEKSTIAPTTGISTVADAMNIVHPQTVTENAPSNLAKPVPSARSRRQRLLPSTPVLRADSSSPEKPLILDRHRFSTDVTPVPRSNPPSTMSAAHPGLSPKQTKLLSSSLKSRPWVAKASERVPWEVPALSKDSVVGYAEAGTERQVRSERGGWFREEGVLVGVRFVVG
ncbi:MAG: hypothetical protein Q9170_002850 [Blastenia crenularia]